MLQKQNKLWFTLVELIVVITIVGILSTVWFVSYSGYLTWARDSNRVSQLTKLSDSLQVYSASKSLPIPDNYVEITASGTTIAYQWEVWVDVLETIDYTNGWKDPKDGSYYTYYLTKDRKSIQLMAMMEEERSKWFSFLYPQKVQAIDYEERHPVVYGRKLWILTQDVTNTPIQMLTQYKNQDFDVVNETAIFTAHLSNDEKLIWASEVLQASIHNSNCNRIKQVWAARGNWIYTLNLRWDWEIEAYCEMETAWWGWTLVSRPHVDSTESQFTKHWSVRDDDYSYSIWIVANWAVISSGELSFTEWGQKIERLYWAYTTWKNMDIVVRLKVIVNWETSDVEIVCDDVIWNSWILSDCSNMPQQPGDIMWTNLDGRQLMYFVKEAYEY